MRTAARFPGAPPCNADSPAPRRRLAAYEVAVVFEGLDNFKGYMESDFKTKVAEPQLAKASELFTSEVYIGNRVYDEL